MNQSNAYLLFRRLAAVSKWQVLLFLVSEHGRCEYSCFLVVKLLTVRNQGASDLKLLLTAAIEKS